MTKAKAKAEVEVIEPRPVEGGQSTSLVQVIERAVLNPDIDVDKMERLLAMHERISAKQAEGEFNVAMGRAQGLMRPISADMTNSHTKSKYVSYVKMDLAIRKIYTQEGFSLSFDSGDGAPENHVRVLCYVGHSGGFTRTYKVDMPADGKGAKGNDVMTKTHAAGSAFTYGQRYLLKLIFNVAVGEDDDDGNAAGADTIDEKQKGALIDVLAGIHRDYIQIGEEAKAGAITGQFLRHMGVDYIEMIPARKFQEAMTVLATRKGKIKK